MQETSGVCLQHQRGPGGGGRRDGGHLEVLGREGVGFQSLHYENLPETIGRGGMHTVDALKR